MKERKEPKDREEEAKRKESGMCLSHPLCRAVTMAHYGPIYRSGTQNPMARVGHTTGLRSTNPMYGREDRSRVH